MKGTRIPVGDGSRRKTGQREVKPRYADYGNGLLSCCDCFQEGDGQGCFSTSAGPDQRILVTKESVCRLEGGVAGCNHRWYNQIKQEELRGNEVSGSLDKLPQIPGGNKETKA